MNVKELIDLPNLKKQSDKLYVYGAGYYASVLFALLSNPAYYIDAIVVSKKEIDSITINEMEYSLKSLEEVKNNNAFYVFAMKANTAEEIISKNAPLFRVGKYITISDELFDEILIEKNNIDCIEYMEKLQATSSLFSYVEIETINRCNGTCAFCPVNANALQRPYCKMETQMFESIILQLEQLKYNKQLALFSNNEPFLDERIIEFARFSREHLPEAYIYIFTNAKLLSLDMFIEILKYLDMVQIDIYQDEKDVLPSNIAEIKKYVDENKLSNRVIFFQIAPDAIRYSRGGNAPNSKVNYSINEICRLPLIQMVIRPDGKISLCCNDALGQMTIGDLKVESVYEAWNSEKRRVIQRKVIEGRMQISLCEFCNNIDRRDFVGKQ